MNKYEYLINLITSAFGAKAIRLSKNGRINDSSNCFKKSEFSRRKLKKYREIFKMALLIDGSEFEYKNVIKRESETEKIDKMKICAGINRFLREVHNIEVESSFEEDKISDYLQSVYRIVSCIMGNFIFEIDDPDEEIDVFQIGYKIYEYISDLDRTPVMLNSDKAFLYNVRYRCEHDFKSVFEKLNVDWTNREILIGIEECINLYPALEINSIMPSDMDKLPDVEEVDAESLCLYIEYFNSLGVENKLLEQYYTSCIRQYNESPSEEKLTAVLWLHKIKMQNSEEREMPIAHSAIIDDEPLEGSYNRKVYFDSLLETVYGKSTIGIATDYQDDKCYYSMILTHNTFKNCRFSYTNAEKFNDIYSKSVKNEEINITYIESYSGRNTMKREAIYNNLNDFIEDMHGVNIIESCGSDAPDVFGHIVKNIITSALFAPNNAKSAVSYADKPLSIKEISRDIWRYVLENDYDCVFRSEYDRIKLEYFDMFQNIDITGKSWFKKNMVDAEKHASKFKNPYDGLANTIKAYDNISAVIYEITSLFVKGEREALLQKLDELDKLFDNNGFDYFTVQELDYEILYNIHNKAVDKNDKKLHRKVANAIFILEITRKIRRYAIPEVFYFRNLKCYSPFFTSLNMHYLENTTI